MNLSNLTCFLHSSKAATNCFSAVSQSFANVGRDDLPNPATLKCTLYHFRLVAKWNTEQVNSINWSVLGDSIKIFAPKTETSSKTVQHYQWGVFSFFVQSYRPYLVVISNSVSNWHKPGFKCGLNNWEQPT